MESFNDLFEWSIFLGHRILVCQPDDLANIERNPVLGENAQTDNDLIKRANGKEKSDATSYTNKNTAISVIDKTIKQNAEDIANWLLNTDIDTKTLLYTSKESIGKGVYRGEKNVHRDIRQAVTVLKRDPSAKEGFIILTSFPVLKWRGK
ncbi:hypothetical protein L3V64_000165 [Geobacillus stearothermophilus]|uniref:RNase A-like domain-containing protein n=1 Tax=Geobacillus stearothermophilus TaxID=1422 RepID=UPI001F3BDABD|nr:RNase A-like domain-containing protein [Geobacillus stearothermophilus]MCK7604879.1 hypothetical protein [Geobacillus stearothermophilus]